MYFKKLEIIGFKSFFNKTILNFEPGVTAVVGPNGTGKSNVFDAIRWVLGEQSVKSLRGSEMQDVIFNGTDSKEPLSLAEVTLTFDNDKRFFNVDHHEVAITRRIFRSGESEYLLNKQQVRLKDILDLLMGTGIGAESYSLVEQGKIDLVLSSKPEDRRLVFDEASGITKYKSQKKEALRKLEETEQNLLRVNDIVSEVKRQIVSLERQANKARRYKELFEGLKKDELAFSLLQKTDLEKQKEEIIKQLAGLEVRESGLLNALKEQEAAINGQKLELNRLEDNIALIRDEVLSLDNTVSRNNERIEFDRERIVELKDNKKYLVAQIEQTKARLKSDEEKLNKVKEEYANISKNIEEKTSVLKDDEAKLKDVNASIKFSLENISCAKRDILGLASKISNARNDINDANSKQQIFLARKKRLDIEKAKINEEKAVAEDGLGNITSETGSLKASSEALLQKITGLKNDLGKESMRFEQADSDIVGLEKQRLILESQREFLDKLKTKYEDINERMNAVIYLDKAPAEGLSGLVVKIKDGTGENSEKGDPGMAFKLSGEAKPIDLDTQRITSEINRIEEKINLLKASKVSIEARITELKKLMQGAGEESRNLEIALANKKSEELSAITQFNKIKEEEGIILAELTDVQGELLGLTATLTGLQSGLDALEKEHAQKEELISQEQNNIALSSGLKEKTLIMITQTKTELDNLAKRIGSDESTLKILEDTYRQDKEAIFNLENQLREAEAKEESLRLEIKDLEDQISGALKNKEEKTGLLTAAQDKYKEAEEKGSGTLKQIELDRQELDSLKAKLYELQMQGKDLDFNVLGIKERMLQNYKVDLDSCQGREGEGIIAGEVDALKQHIKEMKEKLDSYGTVNLVAIEEYDELKKRYDFLNQQQTDLNQAKECLHEAIQKINRTTKKMFLETFEKVREEFRNYFRMLFNGGDAQVFLIDEQDPLESGIEIVCRPPGKKLQNVLLLSGGEKSMSAIALIFAIFKVRPSPFCVLDEIDAALDEVNVDRFARLLQGFIADSQFIVITHNKRTIANANVMYGITMEESGVSKIVSVKFGRDKKSVVNEPLGVSA